MYKFIIGNVRIHVIDDEIPRNQAIQAARQAILSAGHQNKLLSCIEVNQSGDGIDVNAIEKTGSKMLRKSLKQSMLDAMLTGITEKLNPTDSFTTKDAWYDNETTQEWHGNDVTATRNDLIKQFEEWYKSI